MTSDARNRGGCSVRCSRDEECIDGLCQGSCASYGASQCETPSTTCSPILTCGGNEHCWAMPTTSGCCACSAAPGRSHDPCTNNEDCVFAARCDQIGPGGGFCSGDQEMPCSEDADCASLLTCRSGACGGQICKTDADCEEALGPGTVCISGAELPCTANGANICWTLCTGT